MLDGPILLIDDEPAVLEIMRSHLADQGCECVAETSPLRALEALRRQRFTLLITDLNMPELNGVEVVRRAKEIDPELAVVVVTGMVDITSAIAAMHAGANDYVLKPFNLGEIGLAASRALENRALIIQNQQYQEKLELRVHGAAEHLEQINSELRDTKQYLESLLNSTVDAIITTNPTNKIEFINAGALNMLGYSEGELTGQDMAKLYASGTDEVTYIWRRLHENTVIQNYETQLKSKNEAIIPVSASFSCVFGSDGAVRSVLAICKDITVQKNLERELKEMSIKDSLTGLYNMRHFYDRLPAEIERSRRQQHPLSLLLFDIDQFKGYNDGRGHLEGDRALQTVGSVILECTREHVDLGFRYGGDEFTVLLPETDAEQGARVADRIRKMFERSAFDGLTLSIGLVTYRQGFTDKSFVQAADSMMYESKRAGGNRVSEFKAEPHRVA